MDLLRIITLPFCWRGGPIVITSLTGENLLDYEDDIYTLRQEMSKALPWIKIGVSVNLFGGIAILAVRSMLPISPDFCLILDIGHPGGFYGGTL